LKILFTADLHIKLGQKNVPIEWALNRYNLLDEQLNDLQKQADIIVLGGDIFDKLPNMAELDVYFKLISSFDKPTFIIDGNHEATKKGATFFSQLKFVSQSINHNVVVIDDYFTYESIDFIPYCKLKDFEKNGHEFSSKVLVTHVRGEITPHVKPEVDLDIFNKWQVVLAGDLHSYDNCQRNILYPGSPVTTSFHRNSIDTGVILFDTDTMGHEWSRLELPQLLKETIKAGDPMPATDYHHTIYEVEGDLAELSNMEDSILLDKKVVKRSVDTALMLSPDMTLAAEVDEYLRYILQLNDKAIENALKELNNYADKIQ
jgi:DNA repair exonuclease SbcCD nuclease subunit